MIFEFTHKPIINSLKLIYPFSRNNISEFWCPDPTACVVARQWHVSEGVVLILTVSDDADPRCAQVMSWGKLRRVEYAIIWLTLVTVTVYGLEGGILMGIIAALASFAFEYSKLSVTCFNVAASRSSYMRTFQERDILDVRLPPFFF
jgi:hypothetical protein